MNILFCTQSESLQLFDALGTALKSRMRVERTGFIVADSMAYGRWLATRPNFETEGHELLKEWEVTARPLGKLDLTKLAQYEADLGCEAGLFGAIVADRRMFMGPDCAFTQDYRRRYSDDELLFLLQRGIEHMEALFDRLKPDLVVSFICVTMLDYVAYLVAKARGIAFFNLRPTRIGDRVAFSHKLNDPAPELAVRYEQLIAGEPTEFHDEALSYIRRVREQHGRYEGVVRTSDKPALELKAGKFARLDRLFSAVRSYLDYRSSISASDNHVPDPLRRLYFTAWRNPRHARRVRNFFRDRYVSESELKGLRYVFFPLHTEPEVSLLVYGRPYVNQIEIVRMLAMSLPVNMVLVAKEHPWMVGKRSLAAYKKMLDIPRVRFANPATEARTLVKQADLVAVVTGSVALEAAMLDKPVITFGDCPYNLLPETMVRRCADPRHLQILVRQAIEQHKTDEEALHAYVASVFETSAGVNLYSVLLGKANVYTERSAAYRDEIEKLAEHLVSLIGLPPAKSAPGAATW
ncbi:capsule polysaccharide biosynthesis domain-containing protein [Rhizobium etli]|uniref:capsular polysaccharide export protein, LipB/KpsS family n=1 Tax=Rhizobium etli TaxID=29449 RepID=UPI0003839AF2|nr:capsule polysaccharide biosynthesis domain-containing protein [Rhizobium etli]AGS20629.1 capsule polysaccharide biosynthesis domain-containing protein [Rhizobium etli bv. mimosae str. Mim1]